MKKGLLLTAYNRPKYLKQTLESWGKVRDFKRWPLHVLLEPSEVQDEMIQIIRDTDHPNIRLSINPYRYGVLKNPFVGMDRMFRIRNYDFVVRLEDDIIVSSDILEYFDWASYVFEDDPRIALVQAMSGKQGLEEGVEVTDGFSPWDWGTWKDRWLNKIGPTWDLDYSTYNGTPGNQSGWDWNLNTRLLPKWNMQVVQPLASRSFHIGAEGTHAFGELQNHAPGYKDERDSFEYRLIHSAHAA